MGSVSERNIIVFGPQFSGKSHCGNGILGIKNHFKVRKGWSSYTMTIECGSATRNGLKYRVFDTPGIECSNIDDQKNIDIFTEIKRCLFCTSPGFHALVVVLSADEIMTNNKIKMLKHFEEIVGKKGFDYMIIAVTKMNDDYDLLNQMIQGEPEIELFDAKCQSRRVIFGANNTKIPDKCLQRFDMEVEELIKKNRLKGQEYFEHEDYEKANSILEKDKTDYLNCNPKVSSEDAMEIVRVNAALGKSPRDDELRQIAKGQPGLFCYVVRSFLGFLTEAFSELY
uniref:Immune-associated nucleotide-binding protein 13-like n=1 Tax=Crassostrea virginica TaxID=6565 RepID=A0A8B8C3J6_CRAVI|nr:immune-associated nucleotide-binding protein 13-like [Crassostrea virginica]